jgi:hypothetical protein
VIWYKVHYAPGTEDDGAAAGQLADLRAATRRGSLLGDAFEGHPDRSSSIRLTKVLAFDESELVTVSNDVPGHPLGRLHPFKASTSRRTRRAFWRIGKAFRLIEDIGPELAVRDTNIHSRIEWWLEDKGWLPDRATRQRVEARLQALFEQLRSTNRVATYVHGDPSRSNLLVKGSAVGLIDPDWPARLTGHDLATLIVRLELEALRLERWTRPVVGELIRGYGELGPGYHIERSQRLLRLGRSAGAVQRRRILAELTTLPGEGRPDDRI